MEKIRRVPQEELERDHLAMVVLYLDYLLWFVFAPVTLILPYLFAQLILPWRDFPHWLFSEVPAGLLVSLQRLRYKTHRLERYLPAEHGGIQDYRRWWLGGPKRQAFYTIAAIFCTTEVVQFWLWFTASGFFCPTICPGAYMGDGVTAPLYPFDKDPEEYNQNAWYSPTYNETLGSDKNYTGWPTLDPDAPVPWISDTPSSRPMSPYPPQQTQTASRPLLLSSSWTQGFPGDAETPSPRPGGKTRPVVTSFAAHPIPSTTWPAGLDLETFTDIRITGPQVAEDETGSTMSPPAYPPIRTQPD
jgi:hypothetical protein